MSSRSAHPGDEILRELDEVIATEPEADRVLRGTTELVARAVEGVQWVGIYVVEESTLELGPTAGDERAAPDEPPLLEQAPIRSIDADNAELAVPVRFDDTTVALLVARTESRADASEETVALLRDVAIRISSHCLVAWDTGGVAWEDVS